MPRLAAALALAASLSGCVTPLVLCGANEPCAQEQNDNQHTEIMAGIAVVGLVAATILVVHYAHSHDDGKPATAAQTVEPPPPPGPAMRPADASDETSVRASKLVAQARIAAAAGRCEAVNASLREMWTFAPAADYQGLAAEPAVAACLQ